MIKWTLNDDPIKDDEDEDLRTEEARKKVKCTIFLGYTSNMVSCGMREYIRYLC
jgi:deoxyhypusine synthase